jgi:hypothetical protein
MKVVLGTLGAASGALSLLATSQCTPAIAETAQQDQVITATASASTRSAACTSSIEKASNLCMLQGLFNIGRLNCDCTQADGPGTPIWECVATAACKK